MHLTFNDIHDHLIAIRAKYNPLNGPELVSMAGSANEWSILLEPYLVKIYGR